MPFRVYRAIGVLGFRVQGLREFCEEGLRSFGFRGLGFRSFGFWV